MVPYCTYVNNITYVCRTLYIDLFTPIPFCAIEMCVCRIADSELGDTAAMQQLCKGLRQNTSLKELRYTHINIIIMHTTLLLQYIKYNHYTHKHKQSTKQQYRCRESGCPPAAHPALHQHSGTEAPWQRHREGVRPSNQGSNGADQPQLTNVCHNTHQLYNLNLSLSQHTHTHRPPSPQTHW